MPDCAEDRDAIRDLLARYTYNGDSGRIAELAACFADDGTFEFPGAFATGPAEVAASLGRGTPQPGRTFVRHHITNPLIDVAGDIATARSYFAVWSNNGPDHAGTYNDKLVRTMAGWRFAHRQVRIDWQAPGSLWPVMASRRA